MPSENEIIQKLQKIESFLRDKYLDEGAQFYRNTSGGSTNERIFQVDHLRDKSLNNYWQRLTITVHVEPVSGEASVSLNGKWKSGLIIFGFGFPPPLGEYEKNLVPEFQSEIDSYKLRLEESLRTLL